MMIKAMRAEGLKFRRCPVWLAFAAFTVLAAVLGTANYLANIEVLKSGWKSLWTQHTLFACMVFLPAQLGVLCAWQWRLEHTDHCWNRLLTAPVPFAALYLAKLLWAVLAGGVALAFTLLGYLVGGLFCGLPLQALPPQLAEWFLCGWLGCFALCAWQQLISMLIRSFAVPVAAALLASITGMLLMAKGYGLYWPWALLSMGMRTNNPNRALALPPFLLAVALYTLLPTLLALCLVRLRDVRTE